MSQKKFALKDLLRSKSPNLALIILNQPITLPYFKRLWSNAKIKVCADGGCQALMTYAPSLIPDYIIGDMDSTDEAVLEHFKRKMDPSHIIKDTSQNQTDMEKCCGFCIKNKKQTDYEAMVVVGGMGGPRWDQFCGGLHCCFRWAEENIIMCDETGACYVLPPGEHDLEMEEGWEGPHCGIFPMQCEAQVETEGLKHDLKGEKKLAMGKNVSVSNTIKGKSVRVKNDKPVLWIEEINGTKLSTD